MRAAAIMAPPRARNWQSQRVTPRSGAPGTGFHPEPAHRGQTSAAVFILPVIRLCTRTRLRRNSKAFPLCAHPVESGGGLWRTEENCRSSDHRIVGSQIARSQNRRSEAKHFALTSHSPITTQRFALGVKSGNWHVFPIDNPAA
jgi:hypothetical protein